MIITLKIPDVQVEKMSWLPEGTSRVRVTHQLGEEFNIDYWIVVKDEWIVERS